MCAARLKITRPICSLSQKTSGMSDGRSKTTVPLRRPAFRSSGRRRGAMTSATAGQGEMRSGRMSSRKASTKLLNVRLRSSTRSQITSRSLRRSSASGASKSSANSERYSLMTVIGVRTSWEKPSINCRCMRERRRWLGRCVRAGAGRIGSSSTNGVAWNFRASLPLSTEVLAESALWKTYVRFVEPSKGMGRVSFSQRVHESQTSRTLRARSKLVKGLGKNGTSRPRPAGRPCSPSL